MKCITLLLDGASDRSYKALNNKTPLQYAQLPNLDKIAINAQCGLMTPFSEGVILGTDLAHFLMFGYQFSEYPNRSIIDAIGEELHISGDELYLRCSVATVVKEEGYKILKRFTPELSDDQIAELSSLLNTEIDGYSFKFIHSYDSHGFIVIKGPFLSTAISDSDPFRKNKYVMEVLPFEENSMDLEMLASAINRYLKYTFDVLSCHELNLNREKEGYSPGNMILTKWAGMYHTVEPFKKRNGLNGVIIGSSQLLKGLARYIGMDYYHYTDFSEAVNYALTCDYDYVHLHTKDPDTASHRKDPFLKVRSLESIDYKIRPLLSFDGLLIVTSDHSTPCAGLTIHSGESVAFMARGEFIRMDAVVSFDEIACSQGSLFLNASDYMNYIINGTDRGCLYHLRQGKKKRHFIDCDEHKLL